MIRMPGAGVPGYMPGVGGLGSPSTPPPPRKKKPMGGMPPALGNAPSKPMVPVRKKRGFTG